MNQEHDRLQRQLRALTAVNRQLQAQLEGSRERAVAPAPGARRDTLDLLNAPTAARNKVRRSSIGDAWMEQLATDLPTPTPALVRRPDGTTFLVEGDRSRRLRSGLLVAALEQRLGPRRDADLDELDRWEESAPVEVLEAPTGPPFIVVGGERVALRGLPLSHPVGAESAALFADGRELDLSPGGLARARIRSSLSMRHSVGRLQRASARRGGPVPALVNFLKRQVRRVRRRLG